MLKKRAIVTCCCAVLGFAACDPHGPRPPRPAVQEPVAETCATRLPPRAATTAATPVAAPAFAAARSTIIVNAEVPLAGIKQALEAKVPRRVAEERDHDLGIAGRLEYSVDRGAFAVRMESDALVVEAPLQGRAQACAKGRCYAGCAPEAKVLARVPLRLSADYKLRTSEVRIDITKGCEVRALGGLVTVDVTGVLRGALAHQQHNVQASIDRELPDLGAEAARLWTELSKPRALPLGACVVLAPEEITQGPASGTLELAKMRFGLLARPEVRVRCGAPGAPAAAPPPPAKPLPPLRDDLALPAVGDVHLAIVLPEDAPARGVERADVIEFGGRRARISRASGDARSGLSVELTGEVCGDAGVSFGNVAWSDPQSLHVTGAALQPGEAERLGAAQLDGARLVASVEHAPIALPIAVNALESLLPELARGMNDDKVTVSAAVESAKPETAGLRGSEAIAVALLRGAVTIRVK